jgi:hypothetical protein
MIIKNRWIVSRDSSRKMACWHATVPDPATKQGRDDFMKSIYNLAFEEELYRVVKKNERNDKLEPLVGLTCVDIHAEYQEDGSVDYLTDDGLNWFEECEEQSKISYYDLDGRIVTEWIGNLYDFHTKLRPDIYPDHDKIGYYIHQTRLPIGIDSGRNKNGDLLCVIILPSDIWFPRVVGWGDVEEPSYDNSELAALNTPRLNRFLQQAKELTLSLGGTWELQTVTDWEARPRETYVDKAGKKVYPLLSKYEGIENIPPECQVSEDGISLEVDIKPRNYWWVSEYQEWNPSWEIQFPKKRFKAYKDLWPLIKTILEVGQREEIFRVLADEAEFRQFICDIDSGVLPTPYLELLHRGGTARILTERFKIRSLPDYVHRLQAVTKVSCYNLNGNLIDKYVDDQELGWFLRKYHQGLCPKKNMHYKYHLYPGSCIDFHASFDPDYEPDDGCCMNIELCSDIWFPRVEGCLERKNRFEGGYDNSELANRHTPRLNRFLEAIHDQVIKMGGKWSIPSYVAPRYREKMTLTGIKLND